MTSIRLDATDRARLNPSGLRLALAGMLVGLLYAAVSVYWGLGGTTLLDTVGGSLERGGRAGDLVVVVALWAAVGLKAIAAVLPLLAIHDLGRMRWQRLVVALTWIEAAVLVIYGLVLTTVGLLVQLGVIAASASADHRALAWHAYLWDPWFLAWGLLVTAALLRTRHRIEQTTKLDPTRVQPSAALAALLDQPRQVLRHLDQRNREPQPGGAAGRSSAAVAGRTWPTWATPVRFARAARATASRTPASDHDPAGIAVPLSAGDCTPIPMAPWKRST